jgi:hypothetical protein
MNAKIENFQANEDDVFTKLGKDYFENLARKEPFTFLFESSEELEIFFRNSINNTILNLLKIVSFLNKSTLLGSFFSKYDLPTINITTDPVYFSFSPQRENQKPKININPEEIFKMIFSHWETSSSIKIDRSNARFYKSKILDTFDAIISHGPFHELGHYWQRKSISNTFFSDLYTDNDFNPQAIEKHNVLEKTAFMFSILCRLYLDQVENTTENDKSKTQNEILSTEMYLALDLKRVSGSENKLQQVKSGHMTADEIQSCQKEIQRIWTENKFNFQRCLQAMKEMINSRKDSTFKQKRFA